MRGRQAKRICIFSIALVRLIGSRGRYFCTGKSRLGDVQVVESKEINGSRKNTSLFFLGMPRESAAAGVINARSASTIAHLRMSDSFLHCENAVH